MKKGILVLVSLLALGIVISTVAFVMSRNPKLGIAPRVFTISQGGTNSSTIGPAGSVAYSNASSYLFTATGTVGQVLTSNGTDAPTWAASAAAGGVNQRVNTSTINFLTAYGSADTVTGTSLAQITAGTLTFSSTTDFASLSATNVTSTNVSSTNSYSNSYTGTWNGSLLSILVGGTNSSTIAANGSIIYSDGARYNASAVGTSGQILQSAGSGTPVWVTTTTMGFVNLQGATSGTLQTGNFNISGTGLVGTALGINSTSPIASLAVKGIGGTNLLEIASSTDGSMLTVLQNGY